MKKIIALTTCHNRKKLTIRCLNSLLKQDIPDGYSLEVCIVDDGSTDGTSEVVKSKYPEVTVLNGDGSLYWCGGMRYGWNSYVSEKDPDFLIVFNDDIELSQGVLKNLLTTAHAVEEMGSYSYAITAAFKESNSEEVTYGGLIRSYWWHPLIFRCLYPDKKNYIVCDTLNMNLSLVSKKALQLVGFLSPEFTHRRADFDFGLRLRNAGGNVILAPGFAGVCDRNSKNISTDSFDFVREWKKFTSIKAQNPKERALYYRRHAGFLWVLYWIFPYISFIYKGLLRYLKNDR